MGGLFIGRSSHGEHERRAALILDGMYQFVALLNPEGDILEVNRAALEGAGHRIEEIRGKPFWTARWWQVSEKIREELKAAIRRAAAGEFVRYEATTLKRTCPENALACDPHLEVRRCRRSQPPRDDHSSRPASSSRLWATNRPSSRYARHNSI